MATSRLPRFMSSTVTSRRERPASADESYHDHNVSKPELHKLHGRYLAQNVARKIYKFTSQKRRCALKASEHDNTGLVEAVAPRPDFDIAGQIHSNHAVPCAIPKPIKRKPVPSQTKTKEPTKPEEPIASATSTSLEQHRPLAEGTGKASGRSPLSEEFENRMSLSSLRLTASNNLTGTVAGPASLKTTSISLIPTPSRSQRLSTSHHEFGPSSKADLQGLQHQFSERQYTPSASTRAGLRPSINSRGSFNLRALDRAARYSCSDTLVSSKVGDRIHGLSAEVRTQSTDSSQGHYDIEPKPKHGSLPSKPCILPTAHEKLGSSPDALSLDPCSPDCFQNSPRSSLEIDSNSKEVETFEFSDSSSCPISSTEGKASTVHTVSSKNKQDGYRERPLSRTNPNVGGRLRIRNSANSILMGNCRASTVEEHNEKEMKPSSAGESNILGANVHSASNNCSGKLAPNTIAKRRQGRLFYHESRPLMLNPNRQPQHVHEEREQQTKVAKERGKSVEHADSSSPPSSESPWPLSASSTEPFPYLKGTTASETLTESDSKVSSTKKIMTSPQNSVKSKYSLKSALNLPKPKAEVNQNRNAKAVRLTVIPQDSLSVGKRVTVVCRSGIRSLPKTKKSSLLPSRRLLSRYSNFITSKRSTPLPSSVSQSHGMSNMSSTTSSVFEANDTSSSTAVHPAPNTSKRILSTRYHHLFQPTTNARNSASTSTNRTVAQSLTTSSGRGNQSTTHQRQQQSILTAAGHDHDYDGTFAKSSQEPSEIRNASKRAHKLLDKASAEQNPRKKGEYLELAATLVEICGKARDAEKAKEEAVAAASKAQIACLQIRREVKNAAASARNI